MDTGTCDKPNVKCSVCKNRELDRLSDKVIEAHLLGLSVVGIYPLLEDETCMFLAMDFDKAEWQNDVSAVWEVCNEFNIPISTERSRSGNGAHIWIFLMKKCQLN